VLTRHYLTASPYQAIAALWLSSFAADSPAGLLTIISTGFASLFYLVPVVTALFA
jgi:hypothetical protein